MGTSFNARREADGEARAYMCGHTVEQLREAGRLTRAEAIGAVRAYVLPSHDTAILAKGHLLYNLATNHDQCALLRSNPKMTTSAVLVGVRHSSAIHWFLRLAASDYAVRADIRPAGARVILLYGCANRDECRYPLPDPFDIARDARDHLAWGIGAHMCIGMHLARIEMEVTPGALVDHVETIEVDPPFIGTNKCLYGFEWLPLRLR
ncbi:cytochrome P450 [Bradyrhizobium sp. USDA 4516]